MKKIISFVLVIVMIMSLFTATSVYAEVTKTPGDFGWGSDTDKWNYWTAADAGNFALTNRTASATAGENCRCWKDILADKTFTWSFDLKVEPETTGFVEAYFNFLGLGLTVQVYQDGGACVPGKTGWQIPTDGYFKFIITREGGDVKVTVTPTGCITDSWTMTPTSETATVEFGMNAASSKGFEIKNMTYTVDYDPSDFGWGSDTDKWNYWTATDAGNFALTNRTASATAGENCRCWKDILADKTFTWSFDLKVEPETAGFVEAYFNFLGLGLTVQVYQDGGACVPGKTGWQIPTDGYFKFIITREGGDVKVTVTPTGCITDSWTMTPTSETATVEFGMNAASSKGFEIKNMTYKNFVDHDPEIKNASLILNDSLSFVIEAYVPSTVAAPTMKFTRNGNVVETSGVYNSTTNMWSFTDNDVYASGMTENIKMELMNGSTVLDTTNYSVKSYCDYILSSSDYSEDTTLLNLVKATLVYGSEAKKFAEKSINGIENYNIGETIANTLATTFDITKATSDFTIVGSTTATDRINSATLNLGNKIGIVFKYKATDNSIFKVFVAAEEVTKTPKNGETAGTYEMNLDKISPTQYDDIYTAKLFLDGQVDPLQTVTYSVNAYCIRQQSDLQVGNLAKAIYMYGQAAEAYTLAH